MQRAHPSVMFTWAVRALAGAFWLFSEVCRAEDAVALRVDYRASAGCPGVGDFLAEVRARTPRTRDVSGGHQGTLSLSTEDGASSSRQVKAAECAQVVSALALMTALAIDPDASTEPVRREQKPVQGVEPNPTVHPSPPPPPARVVPGHISGSRLRPGLGMGLEALGGVAPDPMFLLRPTGELGWTGSGPVFRASVGLGRDAFRRESGGGEFSLIAARLEGCPLRVEMTESVGVLPCLGLDAGRLRVTGLAVTPEAQVSRPWISGVASVRLQWTLVNVLVLEVAGEAVIPFVRDRFYVRVADTVHRAPSVAGGAGVGLGVRFP